MSALERFRTVALLCLSVFGCTGNILTLIIVNQRFFRKTASATFISGLSIADCIVLCLHSLQIIAKSRSPVTSYDCVVFFLLDVFRLISVWIVCFINIERCSLVFNPCHMPRITSRLKSRVFISILFLISLLIFSHYAHHTNIEYVYASNQTEPTLSVCTFKPNFHRLTWEYIHAGLTYWVTIPLCVVCNFIIIKRFHQATRIERTLNNDSGNKVDLSSKQRQLTAMLVASSICFVLTATPSTVHTIYLSISHNVNQTQYVIHIFTSILLHFHHSSNFLVFMFSCARFRMELIELCHVYLRCQIYTNWYRRPTPNTEQVIFYSTKQQKTPIKLLTSKTNTQKRNVQQPQYQNGYRQVNYTKKVRRNMLGHSLQPYIK